MNETEQNEAWEDLAQIIEAGTVAQATEFCRQLPSGQAPLVVSRLTEEQQTRLFSQLAPEDAAGLLGQMIDAQAVDVLEQFEPTAAAAILDELPSYEQADLIGDLDDAEAEAILRQMDPAEAADARALIDFEDDVAGGLMMTEFLRYQQQVTVGDVIDDMRQKADEYRDYDVQYAYVCDSANRLTGVLRLRDLLLAKRTEPVERLMIRNPSSVRVDTSLDELADFFDRHSYLGVPVTRHRRPTGRRGTPVRGGGSLGRTAGQHISQDARHRGRRRNPQYAGLEKIVAPLGLAERQHRA